MLLEIGPENLDSLRNGGKNQSAGFDRELNAVSFSSGLVVLSVVLS